jgi:Protein of unknown function (DUF2384)
MVVRQITSQPGNLSKSAVVGKSLMRAAAYLQISNRALARIIGLSESSITRVAQENFSLEPGSKPFELALLFVRLFRSLDAITGGDPVTARAWIRADNTALNGKPLDLMTHIPGLIDVIAYLDARRAVV